MKKGLLTKNEVRDLRNSNGGTTKICPSNTNSTAIYGGDCNSYNDATKVALASAESNSYGDACSNTNGTTNKAMLSADSNSLADHSSNTNGAR